MPPFMLNLFSEPNGGRLLWYSIEIDGTLPSSQAPILQVRSNQSAPDDLFWRLKRRQGTQLVRDLIGDGRLLCGYPFLDWV